MLFKYRKIIILLIVLCFSQICSITNADPTFTSDITKTEQINITTNTQFKKDFSEAISKFENLNIKISYGNFKDLINTNQNNDFLLILLADKTAELGFYDLSNLAFSKISDFDISEVNSDNIHKFYFPKVALTKEDTITLAEYYSNISYNDQAKETVEDLAKNSQLLEKYDYANYIMALGYYNLNNIPTAQKYINIATKQNSQNISYKILKSKILVKSIKPQQAQKELKLVNNTPIKITLLTNKIISLNNYIKYQSVKKASEKDYYLGSYYYSEGDYPKAIRTLLGCINKNKKFNAKVYAILSRCYYDSGDYDKGVEYAQKSYKITHSNTEALITLGDFESKNGRFKQALKYYKSAKKHANDKVNANIKIAITYSKLSNQKKADEIYENILNKTDDSYMAYYQIGLNNDENGLEYLKKSISINPKFEDAWIDLARIMIDRGNLDLANKYLTNANYIDDNNFRYYYYQSLLKKKQNEINNKNILEIGYNISESSH